MSDNDQVGTLSKELRIIKSNRIDTSMLRNDEHLSAADRISSWSILVVLERILDRLKSFANPIISFLNFTHNLSTYKSDSLPRKNGTAHCKPWI